MFIQLGALGDYSLNESLSQFDICENSDEKTLKNGNYIHRAIEGQLFYIPYSGGMAELKNLTHLLLSTASALELLSNAFDKIISFSSKQCWLRSVWHANEHIKHGSSGQSTARCLMFILYVLNTIVESIGILTGQFSISSPVFRLSYVFYAELRHTKPDNGECPLCIMSCTKTQVTAVSCMRLLAAVCFYVHFFHVFHLVNTCTQLERSIPISRCNTWKLSLRCFLTACTRKWTQTEYCSTSMWLKWVLRVPCCLLKVHNRTYSWMVELLKLCVCLVEQRSPS